MLFFSSYQESGRPRVVRGGAILEADSITHEVDPEITKLKGNVVATYGETVVTCNEAEIDGIAEKIIFLDGIKIVDPVGELSCNSVEVLFSRPFKGIAKGVWLQLFELRLEAEEVIIEEGVWRIHRGWATMCDREVPDYRIFISDLVILPGKRITGNRTGFQLGKGLKVELPFIIVGLDRRQTGLQFPEPTIGDGNELGYKWRNVFVLGNQGSLLYEQRAAFDEVPSVNAQIAWTAHDRTDKEKRSMINIRNEDGERFKTDFMDNVMVSDPDSERFLLGADRTVVFAGRTTNWQSTARPGPEVRMDRPWYVGIQSNHMLGDVAFQIQSRLGTMRLRSHPSETRRVESYLTLLPPVLSFGGALKGRIRADVGSFVERSHHYGWLRTEFGLIYQHDPEFRFTASYVSSMDWGSPRFAVDELYSKRALHLRTDFRFPATDLSLLLKYDFDRKSLYDIEVAIGQVAHCVRPFFAWRKFPGSFAVGFQVRADNLFEALKEIRQEREKLGGGHQSLHGHR